MGNRVRIVGGLLWSAISLLGGLYLLDYLLNNFREYSSAAFPLLIVCWILVFFAGRSLLSRVVNSISLTDVPLIFKADKVPSGIAALEAQITAFSNGSTSPTFVMTVEDGGIRDGLHKYHNALITATTKRGLNEFEPSATTSNINFIANMA